MATGHTTTTVITFALLAMISRTAVAAIEIYHWLDENGIPNYSQTRPEGKIPDVNKLIMVDTTPPDYDPEKNPYSVQANTERMVALREKMEQRREARRERRRTVSQRQFVPYREPVPYYSHPVWYQPIHPVPPQNPPPQIAEPDPIATLIPSGR